MFTYTQERNYKDFVSFDVETTGMGQYARVTEVGAVKVECGEITEKFTTLVDPRMCIPARICALTGITDAMVRGKPTAETVLPAFLDFAGDLPLVAHNARFDCGFLQRDMERYGMERDYAVSDTLYLARHTWKLPCYKLGFLTEYFDIAQSDAHRAWCDAEATAKLYLMLCDGRKSGWK